MLSRLNQIYVIKTITAVHLKKLLGQNFTCLTLTALRIDLTCFSFQVQKLETLAHILSVFFAQYKICVLQINSFV